MWRKKKSNVRAFSFFYFALLLNRFPGHLFQMLKCIWDSAGIPIFFTVLEISSGAPVDRHRRRPRLRSIRSAGVRTVWKAPSRQFVP